MNNTDNFIQDYTAGCLAIISVALASQGENADPGIILSSIITEVTKTDGPVEFYEHIVPVTRGICEWVMKKTQTLPV